MDVTKNDAGLGLLAASLGPQARVFHAGFVVRDFEGAMRRLGEALRVDWAKRLEAPAMRLGTRDGEIEVPSMRLTYSVQPMHVELIEAVPGTLWEADTGLRGHHVGLWTDDLAGESKRLEDLGFPLHTHALGPDGGLATFAYHATDLWLYLELVDSAARAFYPKWFAQVAELPA